MGFFLERESFGDIDSTGEEAGLADYLAGVEMEVRQEALENDPVAGIYYRIFISDSAGRDRYGRPRKRRYPKVVELIGPGPGRCWELREDGSRGLDRLAEETLRGIVPADEALSEFIQRVRDLDKQRKIVRGER